MKRGNSILFNKILIIIAIMIMVSCDLNEIKEIEDVKIKTETRIVIPLAYGTFEIQNFIDYIGADNSILPIDEEGSISFEPVITEIQLPDTFAFQGSLLNVLSHLELRIETENKLPLGITLELIFTDSVFTAEFGPSIQSDLLKPGILDNSGKVSEASHHVETITLTKELIAEYQKASYILANIRFFLPETKSNLIYINQDDFLSLNIGVVVQANSFDELH